ncbi:MAG: polysaccharide biosynthesis/export family protein [Pseudomonadota bacterium]
MIKKFYCHVISLLFLTLFSGLGYAEERYELQPGDVLQITVWKEIDLSGEALIGPDGRITLPLAGSISTSKRSISELEEELRDKLASYVTDPEVTVALRQVVGSRVYVIGKVNRPGMFLLDGEMDVMQALSLAGGTTAFADLDRIRILRRIDGAQTAMPFKYNRVANGQDLESNVLLKSGDTVVVP